MGIKLDELGQVINASDVVETDAKGNIIYDQNGIAKAKEITIRGTVESTETVKTVKIWTGDNPVNNGYYKAPYQKGNYASTNGFNEYTPHELEVEVKNGTFEFKYTPKFTQALYQSSSMNDLFSFHVIATTEKSGAKSGSSNSLIGNFVIADPETYDQTITSPRSESQQAQVSLGGSKTFSGVKRVPIAGKDPSVYTIAEDFAADTNYKDFAAGKILFVYIW